MTNFKSWRPKSSSDEIRAALERAVRILKDAGRELTVHSIAQQAQHYVPEGAPHDRRA